MDENIEIPLFENRNFTIDRGVRHFFQWKIEIFQNFFFSICSWNYCAFVFFLKFKIGKFFHAENFDWKKSQFFKKITIFDKMITFWWGIRLKLYTLFPYPNIEWMVDSQINRFIFDWVVQILPNPPINHIPHLPPPLRALHRHTLSSFSDQIDEKHVSHVTLPILNIFQIWFRIWNQQEILNWKPEIYWKIEIFRDNHSFWSSSDKMITNDGNT